MLCFVIFFNNFFGFLTMISFLSSFSFRNPFCGWFSISEKMKKNFFCDVMSLTQRRRWSSRIVMMMMTLCGRFRQCFFFSSGFFLSLWLAAVLIMMIYEFFRLSLVSVFYSFRVTFIAIFISNNFLDPEWNKKRIVNPISVNWLTIFFETHHNLQCLSLWR